MSSSPLDSSPIIPFLNHGVMPQTGYRIELGRIAEAWRGMEGRREISAVLVLGEAGAGKSRLLEDCTRMIERSGGVVLHAKLYPESSTSLVPLLAESLGRLADAHPTLRVDVESTLPSCVTAIRRLAQLRPTAIVLEDIHLLAPDAIGELRRLLDALADESLLLLCGARPVGFAARGLFEAIPTEEVTLEGLNHNETAELLTQLFGTSLGDQVVDTLHTVTAGNPLALRSALRGALKAGAIAQAMGGGWHTTLPVVPLGELFRRGVRLLSEGMAAHLSPEEHAAAVRLALLGEVIAPMAARRLLAPTVADPANMLRALLFKGIITERMQGVKPLAGSPPLQALPLAFGHTLLHGRLLEEADGIDGATFDALLEIIGENALFSLTPVLALGRMVEKLTSPSEVMMVKAFERIYSIAVEVYQSPDWRRDMEVLDTAGRLLAIHQGRLDPDVAREHEVKLRLNRIRRTSRTPWDEELPTMIDEVLKLTELDNTAAMRNLRLSAFISRSWMRYARHYEYDSEMLPVITEYVARHPELRLTTGYVRWMMQRVNTASTHWRWKEMGEIEKEMEELLINPETSEAFRQDLRISILPDLFHYYDTPEDLRKRLTIAEELEREHPNNLVLIHEKMHLHVFTGMYHEAMALGERILPTLSALWMMHNLSQVRRVQAIGRAAFGGSTEETIAMAKALIDELPEEQHAIHRGINGHYLSLSFYYIDPQLAARTFRDYGHYGHTSLPHAVAMCRIEPETAQRFESLEKYVITVADRALHDLWEMRQGSRSANAQEILRHLETIESAPLLRVTDTTRMLVALDLLAEIGAAGDSGITTAARRMLTAILDWLEQRELVAWMEGVIRRHGGLLTKPDGKRRRALCTELRRKLAVRYGLAPSGDNRIRIGMIGAITVQLPEATAPRRIKGSRVCALLGLMTAASMIERPLGSKEFIRLSASDLEEFDEARRTLNITVHRTRELLGHDAILTDGEHPTLNEEMVEVDLLVADRALQTAESAIREGEAGRAGRSLDEALKLLAGNVPFPGLYDEIYEGLRDELEGRVRSLAVRVGRTLLRDGMAEDAEGMLRRALAATGGDEEINELMQEACIALGRHVEAERYRMANALAE